MTIFIHSFLTAPEPMWPMPLCYPRKDLLFKHVVLSSLAQMSNKVKQKKSWVTLFTQAVFLSAPVALCQLSSQHIFTSNLTEELEIRVGLFSSRQRWAKLCCVFGKTSCLRLFQEETFWGCSLLPKAHPSSHPIYSASPRQTNVLPPGLGRHLPSLPRSSPTLVVLTAPYAKSVIVPGRKPG